MTKEETAKILAVIQATYTNYHPDDMVAAINIWQEMLEEYNYNSIQMALREYVAEDHDFAPNVGHLMNRAYDIEHPDQITPAEAWAKVSNAIRNSAYNAEEEFSKLPPAIQRSVGSASQLHNWALMDSDTVESVIHSNFLRTYNAVAEQEKNYEKLPADVKRAIAAKRGVPMLEGFETLGGLK